MMGFTLKHSSEESKKEPSEVSEESLTSTGEL